MRPECFGLEYVDSDGDLCPYDECLLRDSCQEVYIASKGLRAERKKRINKEKRDLLKYNNKVKAQKKEFFKNLSSGEKSVKPQKRGYKKPGRLMYVDEGQPRDYYLSELRNVVEDLGYKVKATKCLHTFYKDSLYLAKVDTRRKKKIVIYVGDELSDSLYRVGSKCRGLYDSERPNFPEYIKWATEVSSKRDLEQLIGSIKDCHEVVGGC